MTMFNRIKRATRCAVEVVATALSILALSGCAGAVRELPPVKEVSVPVSVPCRAEMPATPAYAVDALPVGSGVWAQMQALRAERKQRQGRELELEAAIRACQ